MHTPLHAHIYQHEEERDRIEFASGHLKMRTLRFSNRHLDRMVDDSLLSYKKQDSTLDVGFDDSLVYVLMSPCLGCVGLSQKGCVAMESASLVE